VGIKNFEGSKIMSAEPVHRRNGFVEQNNMHAEHSASLESRSNPSYTNVAFNDQSRGFRRNFNGGNYIQQNVQKQNFSSLSTPISHEQPEFNNSAFRDAFSVNARK
jgi:hypothetical protein